MVTVTAEDPSGITDTRDVTVTVTNVDEDGAFNLSATTASVGTAITASLRDPDGSVSSESWQWQSSATMDGTYADISGATSASYTPTADEADMYIMATVMYTDGQGAGKSAMSMAVMVGAAGTGDALVDRYDANKNGAIEKSEVITAINDYLFGDGSTTKADVIRLINLYLFG